MAQFLELLKQFKPDVEVITQAWPKLGQPDFTEVITKLIQAKPQAMFSLQYAGDLSAFINQGNVYALYTAATMFNPNLGDYPVLTAVKSLPTGMFGGSRYLENLPDTPSNKAWGEDYRKRYDALVDYLDELDEYGVPANQRVIAALRPGWIPHLMMMNRARAAHTQTTQSGTPAVGVLAL